MLEKAAEIFAIKNPLNGRQSDRSIDGDFHWQLATFDNAEFSSGERAEQEKVRGI